MPVKNKPFPWFVRGDVDGFFGLFVDNILQLMLIVMLSQYACGFPAAFVTGRILPGAAVSILIGNLFYAWQARQLAKRTGRKTVTALPFGINSVSLLAFIFLVMAPVYYETGDSDLAWKVGLAACFLSGLIETAGAFFGSWVRRNTPRAALLSGLAGVALAFMTLGFSFQIFSAPSVALIPAMLVLVFYGSRVKLPLRMPGGLAAMAIGAVIGWGLRLAGIEHFALMKEPLQLGFHLPLPSVSELASVLFNPAGWAYVTVVLPVALFNVIGSIQNLESAEAAGDRFDTKSSLLVNGGTSVLASFLGSPFPTSIYLGHPGWKALGARSGYSVINGAVITVLCWLGGVTAFLKVVPMEAMLGILIWVGLVMVAQAFSESEKRHALAVAIGLIPPLAAWALNLIETALRTAGTNLYDVYDRFQSELYIGGVIALYQGFLLSAIVFSAIVAHVIDREFTKAAVWSFAAALLSAVGLIHAFELTPTGIHGVFGWMAAPWFCFAYAVAGVVLLLMRNSALQEE